MSYLLIPRVTLLGFAIASPNLLASGSGFGGSELQPSGRSSTTRRNSGSSFGSGRRAPSRSGGFGSRRR